MSHILTTRRWRARAEAQVGVDGYAEAKVDVRAEVVGAVKRESGGGGKRKSRRRRVGKSESERKKSDKEGVGEGRFEEKIDVEGG